METKAGKILNEGVRMVARSWPMALIYVVICAALQTIADQPEWARGGQFAASAANLGLGFALVTKMVEQRFEGGSLAGFWSYFGLAVLSAIGIALATIALVIPGVYLFVRWSAAYGFLCVEGEGVTQSLTSSHELTREAFWPILIALMIPLAVSLGGLLAVAVWEPESGPLPLWLSIPGNVAVSAASVLFTALGLAVYALRRQPHANLDTVFA